MALAAAGAILMLRPVLPAVRPFRSGAICLFLAVTLGLSAGTVGPGGERPEWWDAEWVKTRGGMVGETLDWGVETLAGSIGAHILAIFLFVAAVLLLTGASVAGVIKFASDSVSSTTRELQTAVTARRRRPTEELATLERSTRVRVAAPTVVEEPPEFESVWGDDPEEEIAEEPRLAEDPAEDEPGVTRGPVGAGRARAAHAAGPLPARGDRLARLRVGAAGPGDAHALERGRRRSPTPPGRRRSPRSCSRRSGTSTSRRA